MGDTPFVLDPGNLDDAIRRLRPHALTLPSAGIPTAMPAPASQTLRPSLGSASAPIDVKMPDSEESGLPSLRPHALASPLGEGDADQEYQPLRAGAPTLPTPIQPTAGRLGPPSLGGGSPAPISVKLPDPNDPQYRVGRLDRVLGNLSQFAGIPTPRGLEPLEGIRELGRQSLAAPGERYERDLTAAKTGVAMQDTAAQMKQRQAAADRDEAAANKPEKQTPEEQAFAGLLAAGMAPMDAYKQIMQAGERPAAPGSAEEQAYAGLIAKGVDPLVAFKQVKQAGERPQRLTDPFEAFAYGTPEEKQAAKDFLDAEKKAGARYDRPGEIEQRYDLFRKDPDSYREMFGDKGAAQDQAQASRMLRFFDGQRKQIEGDWTLDEPTKAQKLAEIKELEQPYLNPTAPQGGQTGAAGKAGAAQFKSGQTVYDKSGNARKVKRVLSDGRLELE